MTSRAETVLYSLLSDTDAVEYLAQTMFPLECVPTTAMRPVVAWAISQYYTSGMKQAPSREALTEEWHDLLADEEIELVPETEEIDTVEWATANLRSQRIYAEFSRWSTDAVTAMAEATVGAREEVLGDQARKLYELLNGLRLRHGETKAAEGIAAAVTAYEQRSVSEQLLDGMAFGWAPVDTYTYGIHPGELAVLAAGPKTGKSWVLARTAWHEANERGRRTVLFTLENSVEMTWDRIICMNLGIDYRAFQRGQCGPVEENRIRAERERVQAIEVPLTVIHPDRAERTPEDLIRRAQSHRAESVLIDQLTHVKHANPGRKAKHEIVGEIIHDIKALISEPKTALPCLLAHQINRDGVKAAQKQQKLEMYMLAESADVERASDWVFGLYQGEVGRQEESALLQTLAARREEPKAWKLACAPARGFFHAMEEVTLI